MDIDKDQLRKQFSKDWQKHYKLDTLIQRGYKRTKCKKCGKNIWTLDGRDLCADAACMGYQFIGNTPVKKKLSYVDTWKAVEKYFTKHGHEYIKPYPTVARWRDDLYFTVASINDFQPYVVNGELEPPANPLIVPQSCIRFVDISNVGISGRHYTNFVMVGQHAFNTKKTGLFYWKNEAIGHDINYLKVLGIPEEELVFIEDVWAGGGNFGPSIEYFVRGLELGNCVFMQYEVTDTAPRELNTKVIDMGVGLSRLAWMTNGDPTSYDVVFGDVIKRMEKSAGVKIDRKLFLKFAKISGSLNEDEVDDMNKEKERIAKMLGVDRKELFSELEPLQALYASADHLLTLLFTVTDGMLPSNVGGGYNIRMILRRVFGFNEEFNFNLDYEKILKGHADHLNYIFPNLKEGVNTTVDVIDEEKKKYLATKEKAKGKVMSIVNRAKGGVEVKSMVAKSEGKIIKATEIIKKKGGKISAEDLFVLYKSHGIPPEYVVEIAKKNNVQVEMPGNFYKKVKESEWAEVYEEEKKIDVTGFEKTKVLYYSEEAQFGAKVLGIVDEYLILDKSAFYPESGGQVADLGTINKLKVKNVIREAGVILHEMQNIAKFKKGQKVKGKVDLERRKTITRHHVGAHLLNAACREILGMHIWQAGSYKDTEKAHLDVTHYKRITHEELDKIEQKANEYIREDIQIKVEVLPRNVAEEKYGFRLYQGGAVPGKELRIVSIGDIDIEACGGTHHMLKTTGEIGTFKIVKREGVQDGIERLVYKCGGVAIEYIQEKERMLRDAAGRIKVSEKELPNAVDRFFNEWKERGKMVEELAKRIIRDESNNIIEEGKEKPIFRVIDVSPNILQKIGIAVAASKTSSAVLINKQGNMICAAGTNAPLSAKQLLEKAVKKYGGGGGGKENLAAGKLKSLPKEKRGFF